MLISYCNFDSPLSLQQVLGKIRTLPNPNGYANGMKALEKAYKLLEVFL